MPNKWRSMIRNRELRPWLVLIAALALVAVGCAALIWFSIVVPSVELLHRH
jgi:hypothetical protein